MNNSQKLTAWFKRFEHKMSVKVPKLIARTAIEEYNESFQKKAWTGKPWKKTKRPVKKGSLMLRTTSLASSIREGEATINRVRIMAGSRLVPYAKIHNQGGIIERAARSETFVRNRYVKGKKAKYFGGMGAFKKGTTPGQGLTFKAYTINMPQRQFMGHSAALNKRIIKNLKTLF